MENSELLHSIKDYIIKKENWKPKHKQGDVVFYEPINWNCQFYKEKCHLPVAIVMNREKVQEFPPNYRYKIAVANHYKIDIHLRDGQNIVNDVREYRLISAKDYKEVRGEFDL